MHSLEASRTHEHAFGRTLLLLLLLPAWRVAQVGAGVPASLERQPTTTAPKMDRVLRNEEILLNTHVRCRAPPKAAVEPLPSTPGTPDTAPNMRSAEHAFNRILNKHLSAAEHCRTPRQSRRRARRARRTRRRRRAQPKTRSTRAEHAFSRH